MNVIMILCDTLRRDHCGPYNRGKPLNECWSSQAPDWVVPTPNMDRLAARGTVFTNCYSGSTPCMPARRDVMTGRQEFLERGWAPLEEEDKDLARQISGPNPNRSLRRSLAEGHNISYLISDHFHLWEQGAGNYHMGFSGFDFIRGNESDALYTDPAPFPCPEKDQWNKTERHWRNVHHIRKEEKDWFSPQVFSKACTWLEKNHQHEDFYLHLDCFDPHEPLDPPEDILKMFDEKGYDAEGWYGGWPYAKWEGELTPEQFKSVRARYAAKVVLVDRWLGKLFDTMDELELWDDTMVIFTTDHGTFNGDFGRTGKGQTHEFDCKSHIPFIISHPQMAQGEQRDQLVQLVDIYPTVLAALGKETPDDLHGVNLIPVLEDMNSKTRTYALCGMFGDSVTITDGTWTLHQNPVPENTPLNWYSPFLAKFIPYKLGPYENGCRKVTKQLSEKRDKTWLSYKPDDPNEFTNLADKEPERLLSLQKALKDKISSLNLIGNAADEQIRRLGLESI